MSDDDGSGNDDELVIAVLMREGDDSFNNGDGDFDEVSGGE